MHRQGPRSRSPASDVQLDSAACLDRRIRAEQDQWRRDTLLASLSRFQDWLQAAEQAATAPASAQVPFAVAKDELSKVEVLQRQIQDKLMHLESLNWLYRQLGQADGAGWQGQLRAAVHDSNQRWDDLQTRAAAVSKRLKYVVSQREEFEWEREAIQVWLMELDLRLTDVEHFSGGSSLEKMSQLQAFQDAVASNAERVDWLLVAGERLIQRSESRDAVLLEEELQDLVCYCQEVFRRVSCFLRRLVSTRLVFEDGRLSDPETDAVSDCSSLEAEAKRGPGPLAFVPQSTPCRMLEQPLDRGSEDLEWDPSVDVGGSTSHDDEDSSYYSAITGSWEESRWGPSCQLCSSPRSRCGPEDGQLGSLPARARFPVAVLRSTDAAGDSSGPGWRPHRTARGAGTGRQVDGGGFNHRRVESWLGQQGSPRTPRPRARRRLLPRRKKVPALESPAPSPKQLAGACSRLDEAEGATDTGSEDARKCPRLPAWVKRLLLVALGLALLVLASTTLLCPPAPPFPLTLKYLNGPPPT
ncbi:nesprin-4 [Alligator mississippiensis]|uniref:nesprin-4 n=1 Tax=Alligator mississippiensis TaxID=8496 RepID=UPI002877A014|nr:nesprin-4 [Alligator mississippiensis]